MIAEKLEKLESALKDFRYRCVLVERERDALGAKIKELNDRIDVLESERNKIRDKVETMLGSF